MLNKYGLDLDPKLDPELKKNLCWIQIRNKHSGSIALVKTVYSIPLLQLSCAPGSAC